MNPLQQLRDIHLPEQVGWWPLAPGWWLLLALCVVAVLSILKVWRKRRARRRAMMQALRELDALDVTMADVTSRINALLKRLALTYFPRVQSARLYDQAWLDFLVSKLPSKHQASFRQQFAPMLAQLYRPPQHSAEAAHYQALARRWITLALPPKRRQGDHHV